MSGVIDRPGKRSHRFAFPDDLEIPESALADRKFLSSFVHIYNDPRVYKRQRLNGDRTSSRFDVDYNYQIKVVFNEPIVKRKSILSNPQSPKDDSGVRKSVSFLSKITVIDSIDLDGGSSDWTDVEHDESPEKSKLTKSKISNNGKSESKTKKSTQSNGKTSIKENKKKMKDKPSTKNGHKVKSAQKELFKFKITKTFRKFGRSKDKKLKHLQKKFGRRMFKAFVQVKRSFNLKTIPSNVTVPLERITRKIDDVTTPEKSVPSIQDFLISKMTRKVKVTLTPVHGNTGDTNRSTINGDSEIMQNHTIESNSLNAIENFSRTEIYVPSDKVVDSQTATDDSETNQHIEESIDKSHTSTTPTSVHQTIENHHIIKSNGNGSVETNDSSDEVKRKFSPQCLPRPIFWQ